MGVIQRQGIKSSVVIYFGLIIGYLNSTILFPTFLGKEYYGLLQTILAATLILVQFVKLGSNNIIIKFFPAFRDDENGHNGLLAFSLLFPLIGIALLLISINFFKGPLIDYYEVKAPLISAYYYLIIPLTVAYVYMEVLAAFTRSILKAVVPAMIREVYIRIMITLCIIGYILQIYELTGFLWVITASYLSAPIVNLIYLKYLKQLHLKSKWEYFSKSLVKQMVNYTGFVFLGNTAVTITARIDIVMLTHLLGDLALSGIYAFGMYVSTVVHIPMRALNQITDPIISRACEENDLEEIKSVYKQSSINLLLAGSFVFVGIWCNVHNIFNLMPDFKEGIWVILWLSLAKLFDMATGCNSAIIANSKFYKYTLYSNVVLMIITVISNFYFIEAYGLTGAAMATGLSIFLFNVFKMLVVAFGFRIQPFSYKTLILIGLTLSTIYLQSFIPVFENAFIDIAIRSIAITLFFCPIAYALKISKEINDMIDNKFLSRIKG